MNDHNDCQVEVRDHVLWVAHIDGDAEVRSWLESMPAGAIVDLQVDGVAGVWRKLSDGSDGRPSAGFKPVNEPIRSHWHRLQSRRGVIVRLQINDTF